MRAKLGWWLRCLADRIDREGAPKLASPYSFTFELGEGIRLREDGRGCPLAYLGDEMRQRAHDEADKPGPRFRVHKGELQIGWPVE